MALWGRRRDSDDEVGGRAVRGAASVDWFGDPWITWYLGELEVGRGQPELLSELPPARRDYALGCLGAEGSSFATQFAQAMVHQRPTPTRVAILGHVLVRDAWRHRGRGAAATVSPESRKAFFDVLREAEALLSEAVSRWPDYAPLRLPMMDTARGLGAPVDERVSRWNNLSGLEPHNFAGAHRTLQSVSEKWGGSHDLMYQFARFCAQAPDGSAVLGMIPTAYFEHAVTKAIDLENLAPQGSQELGVAFSRLLQGIGPTPEPDQLEALERFVFAFRPVDRAGAEMIAAAIGILGARRPPYPSSMAQAGAKLHKDMLQQRHAQAARLR